MTVTGELKNPFAIILSVEWIIDLTSSHNASTWIERLKRDVHKRKQTSYFITQCSNKPKALKFWQGRFATSLKAHLCVGLIHLYDSRYSIYSDADAMIA